MWKINSNVLYFIIFLSGMSTLFYELIWIRQLTLFFGVGSFAISTIVGTFMGGIALGSFIFGGISEKKKNLIKIYAYLELFIGLTSLVVYLILQNTTVLHEIYYQFYNNSSFYGLSLIRFGLAVFLLIIPSTLIGGTIPLVSKYLIRLNYRVGRDFSKIYYVNTFGGLVGTVLVSFFFVKYFGVNFSFYFAFFINVFIFLSIFALSNRKSSYELDMIVTEKVKTRNSILFVAAVIGFIHVGYEVLWARIFSIITTATTYVFALVLSGFLLGFLLGGYFISRKIDGLNRPLRTLVSIEIVIALLGALMLFFFPSINKINVLFRTEYLFLPWSEFSLPFFVSLIPAILMGATFPLVLKIYSRGKENIGKKTGNLYFSNTIGAIVGSLVVGFVLIPLFGIKIAVFVLVLSGLILAYMLMGRNLERYFIILGILAVLLALFSNGVFDFSPNVLYYKEGIVASVSVNEVDSLLGKYKSLNVDGQEVASTHPVAVIDSKILAHIPLLLADNPKSVVSVGYGTGGTSYSMIQHGVEVYTIEIEKEVVEIANLEFEEMNHGVQNNESLNIIVDDARDFLSATDKEFDVIVTDVTNLKYKSNPSLYSVDYFNILDEKTTDNGIVAAWVPLSFLAFEDLKTLINSFHEVFPHTTVWYYTEKPTHFLVLVGTREKLLIDLEKLEKDIERVQGDLDEIGIENKYDFSTMLFLGENDVESLVERAKLHTDNNPVLEFSNIHEYYEPNQYPNLRKLLDYKKENLMEYFIVGDEDRGTLYDYFIASFKSIESQLVLYVGDVDKAIELVREADELRRKV